MNGSGFGFGFGFGRRRSSEDPIVFLADLLVNAAFSKGTGAATFTRASTVWVPDFEGILRPVYSGSPAFPGSRIVSNRALQSGTPATQTVTLTAGVYVLNITGAGSFTSSAGTATGTGFGAASAGSPDTFTLTVGGTVVLTMTDTPSTVQLENVTGQSVQTPAEYIPTTTVPVTKCYATKLDGSAITGIKGYLSEPAGTNLITQSNNFSDAVWTKTNLATPTQTVIGPDGAVSAWTITDESSSAGVLYKLVNLAGATPYTLSLYIKKTGVQTVYPMLAFYHATSFQAVQCIIDTYNGTAIVAVIDGAQTLAGRSVKTVNCGEYFRVELTATTGSTANHYIQFQPASTTTYGATAASSATLQRTTDIYGMQIEASPFATSYMPTTTATATRAATALSVPASNLPAGLKHISCKWTPTGIGGTQYLWASKTDANNCVCLSSNGTVITLEKKIAGVSETVTKTLVPVAGTTYLVDAYIYADGTLGLKVNSVASDGGSSTATTPVWASIIEIGSSAGVSQTQANITDFIISKS